MPTTLATGISNAGAFDIRPPAGHAYCITDIFSDIRLAGGVPDLTIAFGSDLLTDSLIIIDPVTAIQKIGRNFEIYITNDVYLSVAEAGAASVIGWVGHEVIPTIVHSAHFTVPNAAPAKYDLRPPAGEIWKVTEIGAETMTAVQNDPDVIMTLVSTTNTGAIIASGLNNAVWHKGWEIYLSHDLFLSFDSIGAADNDVGLSIVRVPVEFFGAAQLLLADATDTVQPAEGYEAVVTTWASDTWGGGGAPADSPDVRLSLTDGTLTSTICSEGSVIVDIIQNRKTQIEIDNTHWLEFFEPTSGNQEIAYSGYVRRIEHTT